METESDATWNGRAGRPRHDGRNPAGIGEEEDSAIDCGIATCSAAGGGGRTYFVVAKTMEK